MHTALPGTDSIPKSLPIMRTYARLQVRSPAARRRLSSASWRLTCARPRCSSGSDHLIAQAGRTPGLLKPVTVTPEPATTAC